MLTPISLGINSNDISNAQPDCPELEALLKHSADSSSLSFQKCTLCDGEPALWCELSMGHPCPYLASDFRQAAFAPVVTPWSPGQPDTHWRAIFLAARGMTSPAGPAPVHSAKLQKFTSTFEHQFHIVKFRRTLSATCTSILLVRCLHLHSSPYHRG